MYKHPNIYYEPQHPMLVQIREEKELYNSLPESMKISTENFMDVDELSSSPEEISDEEMDFSDEEADSLNFEPSGAKACGNTCKGKKPMAMKQCERSIKRKKKRVAKDKTLAMSCKYTKYIFYKAYYPKKAAKMKMNEKDCDPIWEALNRIHHYMANLSKVKPETCDFDRYDRFDTAISDELAKDDSPLHELPAKADKKPKKGSGGCDEGMWKEKKKLAAAINKWGKYKQPDKNTRRFKFVGFNIK